MLPLAPPLEPMLARVQVEIPRGNGWLYEPKWDGFRALVFRDGDGLVIGSRKGQPLERYFPELSEPLKAALAEHCVVDGEIVVPGSAGLDFDALLQRIHPAASRVRLLAESTPAIFIAFDLLALGGDDLRGSALHDRRAALRAMLRPNPSVVLTPQTDDAELAASWFERFEGAGLDGVVAKHAAVHYVHGERVMIKVKHIRTADCVVGGYRVASKGGGVASLLLGLYEKGTLHHAGHTSSFNAAQRTELLELLRPLEGGHSFGGGRTPGGPSRWSQGRDLSYIAVEPKLVCEVQFDHLQADRFRHATRFLRWRPDKDPQQCTYDQLVPPHPFSLDDALHADAGGL